MKTICWIGFLMGLYACVPSPVKKYKIAYNVFLNQEADDYEIFVMNTDGSEKKNITNRAGLDWVYYAFGDKLFFVSDRDTTHRVYFLYEMNANGENVRKIYNVRLSDSWVGSRKNGTELLVKPHPTEDSAFHIIDLNGRLVKRLDVGLPYFNDPCFSPDGKQIVFRGGLKVSKREEGFIDELYIINDDGTGLRQLTHYPKNDTTAEWYAYKAGPPCWKPDGMITYSSKQAGNYNIFSIEANGEHLRKLTPDSLNEVYHSWLPDGSAMTYEGADLNDENYEIYIQYSSGKILQLTADTLQQLAPVFVEVN